MYLAVDIGGTKTLIALFSTHGRVIKRVKFKTSHSKPKFMADLTKNLRSFSKRRVRSVVVAIPGTVQKNCSVLLGNRLEWGKLNLMDLLKDLFECPIYFENDASLASIYEGSFYHKKVVFLTFSTGIGGGVVDNGKLLDESAKFEPGHKIYDFNGKKAEWEDIAAASALENFYHIDTATELRGTEKMHDVADRISLGLNDIVKKYHPDIIVLGGPIGKIFKRYAKFLPDLDVKFVRPKRPLESVIYGCYLYAKKQGVVERKHTSK